ncbi:MAG: carbonic anhydrase [Spirochaetales bacterium]|nr:carbonic anhydrase [Spirochaetales bacterium]
MNRVVAVGKPEDIFQPYINTPIEKLLAYHNFGAEHEVYTSAQLLIGMCMDNRKRLIIPDNFAYIIRTGGGNLRYSEFKVSYAIAVGGVQAITLIAHNNCSMVNLMARKIQFIDGLVENGGWDREMAEDHFNHFSPMFEIGNEIDFVLSETKRLRLRYPGVMVAPLLFNVDDSRLYQIREQ